MSKEQKQYLQEIIENAEQYQLGLEHIQQLIHNSRFSDAAEQGLKTILNCCRANVPETADLETLFINCTTVMEDLPTFISLSLPLPEFVNRLAGILMERHAFYSQLKNSSN